MITVAIVKRRLKEGKTYSDFRKAWFHTVGFGTTAKLYTAISAVDPREIIVIGFVNTSREEVLEKLRIDVKERLDHSLDDVIEPEIDRSFGILVAEDDFSAEGDIGYHPPTADGVETDLSEVENDLLAFAKALNIASQERDDAKNSD